MLKKNVPAANAAGTSQSSGHPLWGCRLADVEMSESIHSLYAPSAVATQFRPYVESKL